MQKINKYILTLGILAFIFFVTSIVLGVLLIGYHMYLNRLQSSCDFDITKLVKSCTTDASKLCIYRIDSTSQKIILDKLDDQHIQLEIPTIKYKSGSIDTTRLSKDESTPNKTLSIYGYKVIVFKYPCSTNNIICFKITSDPNEQRVLCFDLDTNSVFITGTTKPPQLALIKS